MDRSAEARPAAPAAVGGDVVALQLGVGLVRQPGGGGDVQPTQLLDLPVAAGFPGLFIRKVFGGGGLGQRPERRFRRRQDGL